MKLKKIIALMIIFAMTFGLLHSFADPTEDFHVEPSTEVEPTGVGGGPVVEEYMVYVDDNKKIEPGSLSGDVNLNTVGRGLFFDGKDFYFFLDTGVMASNFMYNIEGDRFFFGEDGRMVKDQLVTYNGEIYYFDVNGAMYKNRWYSEEEVDEIENTVTYTDYYLGPTGRAYRAADNGTGLVVKTIEGEKYGFNSDGEKLEGYYDLNGNKQDPDIEEAYAECVYYFDPDENGAAAKGWHYYEGAYRGDDYDDNEEIVLYFDEKSCKKVAAKSNYSNSDRCISRIIEGQRYMFDQKGVRRNKWYANEPGRGTASNTKYFSEEYDGYLQKGWFQAVPGGYQANGEDLKLEINKKKHKDDEEVWFYATSNGNILRKTIRKIGNYVYAFDDDGVMQQDAFVKVKAGSFIKAYDTAELNKANVLLDPDEYGGNADPDPYGPTEPVKLSKNLGILNVRNGEQWMYFMGDNGSEDKVGSQAKLNSPIKIELNDEDIYFMANSTGGYTMMDPDEKVTTVVERGNKLMQNGVVLRPNTDDNNYGIVRLYAKKTTYTADSTFNYQNAKVPSSDTELHTFVVVNASGTKVNASYRSIKDKQGNYIYVGSNGEFLGVYPYEGKFYDRVPDGVVDQDGNKIVSQIGNLLLIVVTSRMGISCRW